MLDAVGFVGQDTETGDWTSTSLHFDGDPEREYSLEGTVEGLNDGAASLWAEASASITVAGELWLASSGTMTFTLNAARDEGSIPFSGVVVSVDGEYTTPLYIGCGVLATNDSECAWVEDLAPYSTEFCQEATSTYPDWTWLLEKRQAMSTAKPFRAPGARSRHSPG